MAKRKTTKKASRKKTTSRKSSNSVKHAKKAVKHASKAVPKLSHKRPRISMTAAVVGLLINILIFPGIGSFIGRRNREATWQVILTVIGALLSIVLIGIPILIVSWVWALITGIQMIQDAK